MSTSSLSEDELPTPETDDPASQAEEAGTEEHFVDELHDTFDELPGGDALTSGFQGEAQFASELPMVDEISVSDDDALGCHDDDGDWSGFDDRVKSPSTADDDVHGMREVPGLSPLRALHADEDEAEDNDEGGLEGLLERIEDEVDERALPELDADDRAEPNTIETLYVLPPDAEMVVLEHLLRHGCAHISIHEGRVALAGNSTWLLERGAADTVPVPFQDSVSSLLLAPQTLIVGTKNGIEILSMSGETETLLETRQPPRVVAASHGRIWALVGQSLLSQSSPAASTANGARENVLCLAAYDGGIVALRRVGVGVVLERFRGDDEGWSQIPLEGEVLRIAQSPYAALSCSLDCCQIAVFSELGLARSQNQGLTFACTEFTHVTAVTFAGRGPSADTLLLTWLDGALLCVRVDHEGTGYMVHRSMSANPRTGAMAWDESRGVAFVGLPEEVYLVGRRRTH